MWRYVWNGIRLCECGDTYPACRVPTALKLWDVWKEGIRLCDCGDSHVISWKRHVTCQTLARHLTTWQPRLGRFGIALRVLCGDCIYNDYRCHSPLPITTSWDPITRCNIITFLRSLLHKKFSQYEVTFVNHTFPILDTSIHNAQIHSPRSRSTTIQ
jgi:hypothetical protein